MNDPVVMDVLWKALIVMANIIIAFLSALLSFLFSRYLSLQQQLMEYKLYAANTYATKPELNNSVDTIHEKLDQLLNDLHNFKLVSTEKQARRKYDNGA